MDMSGICICNAIRRVQSSNCGINDGQYSVPVCPSPISKAGLADVAVMSSNCPSYILMPIHTGDDALLVLLLLLLLMMMWLVICCDPSNIFRLRLYLMTITMVSMYSRITIFKDKYKRMDMYHCNR